jgi:hypothetical protein
MTKNYTYQLPVSFLVEVYYISYAIHLEFFDLDKYEETSAI